MTAREITRAFAERSSPDRRHRRGPALVLSFECTSVSVIDTDAESAACSANEKTCEARTWSSSSSAQSPSFDFAGGHSLKLLCYTSRNSADRSTTKASAFCREVVSSHPLSHSCKALPNRKQQQQLTHDISKRAALYSTALPLQRKEPRPSSTRRAFGEARWVWQTSWGWGGVRRLWLL